MKRYKKKKCCHCKQLFEPDPRNYDRQNYCRKSACRAASKSASQKKWLRKPSNKNYFKGQEHVERVQAWRKKNPDYWKRPKPKTALQETLILQQLENKENNAQKNTNALQDLLSAQPPVIIGLISNFIGSPLQDDIANTLLAMQQSGQDILCMHPNNPGGNNDCKNTHLEKSYSQGAQKLQLD